MTNTALGSGVGRYIDSTLEGKKRCDVDDRAAVAGGEFGRIAREQRGAKFTSKSEHGRKVDVQDLVVIMSLCKSTDTSIFALTYLVPVLIREGFAWVTALDTSTVHQDIRLDALADQRWYNILDSLAIRQLGNVDPCLAANLLSDAVLGCCVRVVSLPQY